MEVLPVILSGGSGTRLWPLSREQHPKQLIPLVDDATLLQATAARMEGFAGGGTKVLPPLVVCNEEYRFITAEQLRQIGYPARRIILEPVGRNTAPALTLAALTANADGADPVLIVMPADHVVRDLAAFHAALGRAVAEADAGAVVTFGIVPEWPETGYGYIHAPGGNGTPRAVLSFVEKPDFETASRYLAKKEYFWNSGIFVLKSSMWLDAIGRYRPDILDACRQATACGVDDRDFLRLDAAAFIECPSDSIDYAVMERLSQDVAGPMLKMVPLAAGWSDVGAWDALWQVSPKDAEGNVRRGDVVLHDTRESLVLAESRLVACVGIDDVVVVETPDAVMVAGRERAQEVKRVVESLKRERRRETTAHRKVRRPWGWYDSVDMGERFQVKRIVVDPGARLSLQMHHHRAEHWIVVRGTARVTRGDDSFLVSENESTYIPIGVKHRLENPGQLPLEMIEVQSGGYLGEDDIVRLDDKYGRN